MLSERFLRPDFTWSGGNSCAATIVFNYQGALGLEPDSRGRIDQETYDEREYGTTVGIWRVLRHLEKLGAKATFLVCGGVAERYPETVIAIREGGHEIAGHGYHHELGWKLTPEEEMGTIDATRDMIKQVSGVTIDGWRCCFESPNTRELVLDAGLRWNSNSFLYEMPYLLEKDGRTIVELPRQPLSDFRSYGLAGFAGDPQVAYNSWQSAFDTLHDEAADGATYYPFSLHPFISGRPGRIDAMSRLIEYMQNKDNTWIATFSEVADRVLEVAAEQQPVAAAR